MVTRITTAAAWISKEIRKALLLRPPLLSDDSIRSSNIYLLPFSEISGSLALLPSSRTMLLFTVATVKHFASP
jgi:hypothetical protein